MGPGALLVASASAGGSTGPRGVAGGERSGRKRQTAQGRPETAAAFIGSDQRLCGAQPRESRRAKSLSAGPPGRRRGSLFLRLRAGVPLQDATAAPDRPFPQSLVALRGLGRPALWAAWRGLGFKKEKGNEEEANHTAPSPSSLGSRRNRAGGCGARS